VDPQLVDRDLPAWGFPVEGLLPGAASLSGRALRLRGTLPLSGTFCLDGTLRAGPLPQVLFNGQLVALLRGNLLRRMLLKRMLLKRKPLRGGLLGKGLSVKHVLLPRLPVPLLQGRAADRRVD
jgi:hypothetical protein